MIVQDFYIPEYDWKVRVYYAVTTYWKYEILHELKRIGCRGEQLERAARSLSEGNPDTGSTPEQFQNSWDHEKGHLCRHISQAFGIDPFGEEAQYLSGYVGQKMFPVAKKFLCEHCRNNLIKNHG